MKSIRRDLLGLLAFLGAGLFSAIAQASITIDTVTVGDPGNPNDQNSPGQGALGSVGANYAIGKFEITLTQYTAFLNAVADMDTYSLYNPNMAADLNIAGITRTGTSGNYAYSVLGDGQRPVTYVNWFAAARFANWMHNGHPDTGNQAPGTTEQGAYTLDGATSGVGFAKNAGAQWWIPGENEWYKAAYYQPAAQGGDSDGYWLFPMRTNSAPYSDQPPGATPDDTRVGNFFKDDDLANGYDDGYAASGSKSFSSSEQYLTPVGAYTSSDSYYGTFDQGGNVFEWTDGVSDSSRVLRGGSWISNENGQKASERLGLVPGEELDYVGFRIATVPEPRVVVSLLVAGGLFLLTRRKRPSG